MSNIYQHDEHCSKLSKPDQCGGSFDSKLGCSGLREVQVSTVRVARPSTPSKEYIGEAGRRRNLLQFHPL